MRGVSGRSNDILIRALFGVLQAMLVVGVGWLSVEIRGLRQEIQRNTKEISDNGKLIASFDSTIEAINKELARQDRRIEKLEDASRKP